MRRLVILVLLLFGQFYGGSVMAETDELFISAVLLDPMSTFAEEDTEFEVEVLEWNVPVTKAYVKLTATKGEQVISVTPIQVNQGKFSGKIRFPQEGLWNITIVAAKTEEILNTSPLQSDTVTKMELQVQKPSGKTSDWAWVALIGVTIAFGIWGFFRK